MKRVVLLLCVLSSFQQAHSQRDCQSDGLLRGTVYEAGSQRRLAGANVRLLGTVLGTISNLQGEFVIPRVPVGQYRLRVSMIGFGNAVLDSIQVPSDEIVVGASRKR